MVAQVLLRIPCVAFFLERHVSVCDVGLAGNCVTCALQDTRSQLGRRVEPELVSKRECVELVFGDRMQHDAVEFLQKLLSGMRDVEFLADRIGTTAGVEVHVVTHVERMLSFWEEQRLRCDVCGACRNAFELNNMVVLPLPSQEEAAMTVSDLYLRYCGGDTLDGDSAV